MIKTKEQIQAEIASKPTADKEAAAAALKFLIEAVINQQLYDAVVSGKAATLTIDTSSAELKAFADAIGPAEVGKVIDAQTVSLAQSGWPVAGKDPTKIVIQADAVVADVGGDVEVEIALP